MQLRLEPQPNSGGKSDFPPALKRLKQKDLQALKLKIACIYRASKNCISVLFWRFDVRRLVDDLPWASLVQSGFRPRLYYAAGSKPAFE
jgi:hypothetical protein